MLSIVCEPFACIIVWLKNLMERALESRCFATKRDKKEDACMKSSLNSSSRQDRDPKPIEITKKSRSALEMDWNDF